jgi:sporulation integral membrane protein YlbJ
MTKNKTKNLNYFNFIYISILIILIITIVILPEIAIQTFFQGLLLWATKVLPALLPFFILTKLLSYTAIVNSATKFLSPFTHRLYNVGGVAGYVFFMSIISGYPIGAKITADLYQNKQITSGQAKTISAFTSTSGPLFIIGTVAVGFFQNHKLGFIILISHILGAIINGLLYRNKENSNTHNYPIQSPTQNILNDSMYSSIISIMLVGGFIAISYMILSIMLHLNLFSLPISIFSKFGIDKNITSSILSGIIEVTTGLNMLSKTGISFNLSAIISSFLISFGGLSIHAQAYCYLKSFNLKYSHFLKQKITHAIISASVTFIIIMIF